MRSSRTAIQGRHSEGNQRAGIRHIAESPLIVLLAVLIAAIVIALSIGLTSPSPTIIVTPGPISHQAIPHTP